MSEKPNTTDITWHMAGYIFYNMHQTKIPKELNLSGDQIKILESDMYIYKEDISNNPMGFLTAIYQNYCEINKMRCRIESYIENFLLTYVEKKILKSYKFEHYEFLFRMIFSDVMSAYIVELNRQSRTMFITERLVTYKPKCINIIYEKIQHYTGINIHRSIDPNLETVPLAIYDELSNKHRILQKKFNKLKKEYNKIKKEVEYESE